MHGSTFTSRLPTSIRRPTSHGNHGDGSTSFVNLHRPSNIPVTARKANLFTPQTKRQFSFGTSTAGKSYLGGMTTDSKYKRAAKPAPDRDEQMKMFEGLVDFIRTRAPGMPLPEAKRFFSSISTTESTRIFEFLISCLIPDFKINRLETDVPEVLNQLGYPYIRLVTKSALVSVATRQAAVGLLVIFNWLVVNITMTEEDLSFDDSEVDEVCGLGNNVLLQPDRGEEADEELLDKLYPVPDIQEKRQELQDLMAECEQLGIEKDEKDDLLQKRQEIQEDLQSFVEYKGKMNEYIDKLRNEFYEPQRQAELLAQQIKILKDQEEEDRMKIDLNNMDISDVLKDQNLLEELEEKLSQLREKMAEINKHRFGMDESRSVLFGKLKTRFDEHVVRELRDLYETTQFNIPIMTQRRKEIHEWLLKLEQLPTYEGLNRFQELLKEQTFFINKLLATDARFDAEVKDYILEKKNELDILQAQARRFIEEIKPKLDRAILRAKEDIERTSCELREAQSKIELQVGQEEVKVIEMSEEHEKKKELLRQQLEIDQRRLKEAKVDLEEYTALNREHLQSVLECKTQKANNVLNKAEMMANNWSDYYRTTENNLRVTKAAIQLLKRKMDLK